MATEPSKFKSKLVLGYTEVLEPLQIKKNSVPSLGGARTLHYMKELAYWPYSAYAGNFLIIASLTYVLYK